ncbi:MAG TPA: hypothetical protein VF581_12530 [Flavobacterium sp.]
MKPISQIVAESTLHRSSRDENSQLILANPHLLADLLEVCYELKNPHHHKACLILELIMVEDVKLLEPYLSEFCDMLPLWKQDGAVRAVAKICYLAVKQHRKAVKSNEEFLSDHQLQQLTEICFDWLIGNTKVAAKAHAMRALYEIGKLQDWIHPQLLEIITKDYAEQSPAYRAVTKEILKKLQVAF